MDSVTVRRLGAFGLVLAVVGTVAFLVGREVGPAMRSGDGFALELLDEAPPVGVGADVAFRVVEDGRVVTRLDRERAMRLVVVREDLTEYRHVFPTETADGVWRVRLTFAVAGEYRVFATFRPAGRARDVTVDAVASVAGDERRRPLPAPRLTAEAGDHRVTLSGHLVPDTPSMLYFTIDRDSEPVTDLRPHLDGFGHLTVLRSGDLARPRGDPIGVGADTAAGPTVAFVVDAPAGEYRLYLDFRHDAAVRTVEFTVVAGEAARPGHGGH